MATATVPALGPGPARIARREQSRLSARVKGLPLGELELDAPVAGPRFFVSSLVKRLEFAETSGGQSIGLDSLADQILHHRDRSCG